MIDFRYHVVSLVSVFIALAVGVVLGAGPLRGQIADSLNASVEQLRAEKNELREELSQATAGNQRRDAFTAEIVPDLVAGRLTGDRVALVLLPDADTSGLDPLVRALTEAGATVTARVELNESWADPDAADARTAAQARLAPLLTPLGLPSDVDVGLARALLNGPSASTPPGRDRAVDPLSARILDVLEEEGLLDVQQQVTAPADQAVVVAAPVAGVDAGVGLPSTPAAVVSPNPGSTPAAPAPTGATPSGPSLSSPSGAATPTVTVDPAVLTGLTAMAMKLDRYSRGTVVTGPPSSARAGGLVSAIRDNAEVAQEVTTVDMYGMPMGDAVTAIALQEQLDGAAGAYGFGPNAKSPAPEQYVGEDRTASRGGARTGGTRTTGTGTAGTSTSSTSG